jgi:predicted nucleic acid-binding protein
VSAAGGWPATPLACLVVDANVVMKWHVTEVHSDAALRLLRDDAPALHVPDLVFPQVGNLLWKKVRRGDLTEEQARGIGHLLAVAPLAVHPSAPLLEAALEIAVRTGRTVYDSLYVALAVQLNCRLVTADDMLYNALKDGPLGAHILRVEDDLGFPAVGEVEDFVLNGDGP